MPSIRRDGDRKEVVWDWDSHVDKMIREAQSRGDFDNLPGAGRPLKLQENVFAGDMDSAYRVAHNAGAAPLWVTLDKEIAEDSAALDAMLERTARHLRERSLSAEPAPEGTSSRPDARLTANDGSNGGRKRFWWPFGRTRAASQRAPAVSPPTAPALLTPKALEEERLRARALYLARAADLDKKIDQYNSHRPPQLSWLEKPRLLPDRAARQFDERIPPVTPRA